MEGVLHHVMCHVTVWKSCDGGSNYIIGIYNVNTCAYIVLQYQSLRTEFHFQFSKSLSQDQLAGVKESVSSWTAGDTGEGGAPAIGPRPPPSPTTSGVMKGPMIGPMIGPNPVRTCQTSFSCCFLTNQSVQLLPSFVRVPLLPWRCTPTLT